MNAGPTPEGEHLRSFVAGRDVPCPACGYNLRGTTRGECPECGFGFNAGSLMHLGREPGRRSVRDLLVDPACFWAPFGANLLLVLVYALFTPDGAASMPGATWYDAVAAWPWARRVRLPVLLTLACLSLRWLSHASEQDEHIASRWYPASARVLWGLTAAHALGVLWSGLARLVG